MVVGTLDDYFENDLQGAMLDSYIRRFVSSERREEREERGERREERREERGEGRGRGIERDCKSGWTK